MLGDIEKKYKKQRDFLKFSMDRVKLESKIHEIQQGTKRYDRRFDSYLHYDPIIAPRDAKLA